MPFPAILADYYNVVMYSTVQSSSAMMSKLCKSMDENIVCLYLGFLCVSYVVTQSHVGVGISTFLTLSSALQLFAVICLQIKVSNGSVAGISLKSLIMQALVYICRLSSTTWCRGYIPMDSTGDYLYQLCDTITLLICMRLIFSCAKTLRHTYQEEYDTVDLKPVIVTCVVLAVLVHPDLNARPFFDTLWAASLYIDVTAMLPQLWMMSNAGGAEVLTSHYVAAIAASRCANLVLWYHCYDELGPEDGGANFAGYAIIVAHALQILLMGDFLLLYIKAVLNRAHSLCTGIPLKDDFIFVDI